MNNFRVACTPKIWEAGVREGHVTHRRSIWTSLLLSLSAMILLSRSVHATVIPSDFQEGALDRHIVKLITQFALASWAVLIELIFVEIVSKRLVCSCISMFRKN